MASSLRKPEDLSFEGIVYESVRIFSLSSTSMLMHLTQWLTTQKDQNYAKPGWKGSNLGFEVICVW